MASDFDIVIVGGGAAGIGAARRLAVPGLRVLLLEGAQRLGGRARTEQIAGLALDLGCGWLHSADRNPWVPIAEASGFTIDRRTPAWGKQYRDLGLAPADQAAATQAFADWTAGVAQAATTTDRASDALPAHGSWTAYVRAMAGFMSGADPERISATDYTAYDVASTGTNWRVTEGYGTLIAASAPLSVAVQLATPIERIDMDGACGTLGLSITTCAGTLRTKAAILTVSTAVLSGDTIRLPSKIDDWREAATRLPLGGDEKLFLEITGDSPFAPESHVIGNPHDARTGVYYIRPFGRPVIECFFGGEEARSLGADAAQARALAELGDLFGNDVRRILRPIAASQWSRTPLIGGAYSCALPGHAAARGRLARSYDQRLFFAGEATHDFDFSTAHGAFESGIRAAEEALSALGRLQGGEA